MVKDFQLVLSGMLRADGAGVVALPLVRAADSNGVTTVQVYRDEDTLLSVNGLPAADETLDAPLDSPPTSWTARHVAGYRLDKTAAANIRLEVQPNPVELIGNSLTSLAGIRRLDREFPKRLHGHTRNIRFVAAACSAELERHSDA